MSVSPLRGRTSVNAGRTIHCHQKQNSAPKWPGGSCSGHAPTLTSPKMNVEMNSRKCVVLWFSPTEGVTVDYVCLFPPPPLLKSVTIATERELTRFFKSKRAGNIDCVQLQLDGSWQHLKCGLSSSLVASRFGFQTERFVFVSLQKSVVEQKPYGSKHTDVVVWSRKGPTKSFKMDN